MLAYFLPIFSLYLMAESFTKAEKTEDKIYKFFYYSAGGLFALFNIANLLGAFPVY